mmetsp:Transcript_3038/g.6923  ORF Transcript_3038/g.6923 Transcript_3038/m.6923 type:complete len:409 (-) Transcript_3038:3647-4873(-)
MPESTPSSRPWCCPTSSSRPVMFTRTSRGESVTSECSNGGGALATERLTPNKPPSRSTSPPSSNDTLADHLGGTWCVPREPAAESARSPSPSSGDQGAMSKGLASRIRTNPRGAAAARSCAQWASARRLSSHAARGLEPAASLLDSAEPTRTVRSSPFPQNLAGSPATPKTEVFDDDLPDSQKVAGNMRGGGELSTSSSSPREVRPREEEKEPPRLPKSRQPEARWGLKERASQGLGGRKCIRFARASSQTAAGSWPNSKGKPVSLTSQYPTLSETHLPGLSASSHPSPVASPPARPPIPTTPALPLLVPGPLAPLWVPGPWARLRKRPFSTRALTSTVGFAPATKVVCDGTQSPVEAHGTSRECRSGSKSSPDGTPLSGPSLVPALGPRVTKGPNSSPRNRTRSRSH